MAHFIVAGGGIAGLAAAVTLGRRGHEVEVFERRDRSDDLGAGLQLSPNATRAARQHGLLDAIRDVAIELEALRIRRGRDGAAIATLPLETAARERYGAPFLVMHRADLHAALATAARSIPSINVALAATVTRTDPTNGTATLTGPGGASEHRADGLVRAEGVHARRSRTGDDPAYSGKTAWRALVPAHTLPAGAAAAHSNLWLGERAHVVHYPVRGGALVNVVVIVDQALDPTLAIRDLWAEPGDPAVLRDRLKGWHRDVLALVAAAPGWRTWPLFDGATGRPWSDGCETRVGDAAHPMLPFLAQGASQAFEDAAALAEAVDDAAGPIPAAFRRYELGRAARARRIQVASRRQGRIYHLGGAAAVARDLAIAMLGPERMLARMDWLYGAPNGHPDP